MDGPDRGIMETKALDAPHLATPKREAEEEGADGIGVLTWASPPPPAMTSPAATASRHPPQRPPPPCSGACDAHSSAVGQYIQQQGGEGVRIGKFRTKITAGRAATGQTPREVSNRCKRDSGKQKRRGEFSSRGDRKTAQKPQRQQNPRGHPHYAARRGARRNGTHRNPSSTGPPEPPPSATVPASTTRTRSRAAAAASPAARLVADSAIRRRSLARSLLEPLPPSRK